MDEMEKQDITIKEVDHTPYEGDGKIVPFPASEHGPESIKHMTGEELYNAKPEDANEETETREELINDPDHPLDKFSDAQIRKMIQTTREMVQIMENNWSTTKMEFHLTDNQMKDLFQYNEQHKTPIPDYATEEEREKWDHLNGLNGITEEDAIKIFGEDSPVIGVTHDITKDRIKDFAEDYLNWLIALREYKNVYQSYIKLMELQEENDINALKTRAESETDPENKQKMLNAIELYYNRKYLKFLAEPLPEEDINRIVHAFNTEKTISYWLKRSQDKLKQLKMSTKFILEISQFEKRFLPEKYHKQSNILLLYFMMTIIYCSCSDPKDPGRNKSVAMIMTLDQFVQNILDAEKKDMVLNNIIAFEDQFMDLIPEQPVAE